MKIKLYAKNVQPKNPIGCSDSGGCLHQWSLVRQAFGKTWSTHARHRKLLPFMSTISKNSDTFVEFFCVVRTSIREMSVSERYLFVIFKVMYVAHAVKAF